MKWHDIGAGFSLQGIIILNLFLGTVKIEGRKFEEVYDKW
jgi:hypothetical protein